MNLEYDDNFEKLLKKDCEICEVYYILHMMACNRYYLFSTCINIPIIVVSSVIGFLNVINDMFNGQYIVLGSVSIFLSILKTIDSFFHWMQKSEHHRMTALNYYKIHKTLQYQLCLPRNQRIDPNDLYKIVMSDLQSVHEQEGNIPDAILEKFKEKYPTGNTSRPAILNGLTSVRIYVEENNDPFHDGSSRQSTSD